MYKSCNICNKSCEEYKNFCSWKCHIKAAKKAGGKAITPNNLPIKCIKANGYMLECEHGDHKYYKFPIYLTYKDQFSDIDGNVEEKTFTETAALIYANKYIVVALFECCYLYFYNGICKKGLLKGCELTNKSLKDIKNFIKNNN